MLGGKCMYELTCLDSYGNPVDCFYQWDTWQSLMIKNTGLDEAPIFHFCNRKSTEAFSVPSTISDGVITVKVPNYFLTQPYPLMVYMYVYENELSAKVQYTFKVFVKARKRPSDYVYVENIEKTTLASVIGQIEGVKDKTSSLQTQLDELDISGKPVTFEENENYNIQSGDNTSSLFGKIRKLINLVEEKAPNFLTNGRTPYADRWTSTRYLEGMGVNGTSDVHFVCGCFSPSSNQNKTVSKPGFELKDGARLIVSFRNGNTAANPTLDVNGTGAKPIYYKGAAIPTKYIYDGVILELVYIISSGVGRWYVVGDLTQTQADSLQDQINMLSVQSGAKVLWTGGLFPGGTIEFDIPQECFHNGGIVSLVIESFAREKEDNVYSASAGTQNIFCPISFVGVADPDNPQNTIYSYSNPDDWKTICITDGWTSGGNFGAVYIEAKRTVDSRYAVCKIKNRCSSEDAAVFNCVSAYVPSDI